MKKRYYIFGGAFLVAASLQAQVVINEVDADTSQEFVELYDGGVGGTSLDGLVVVFYNGSDDKSNGLSYDLDGMTTDVNGFFVLGESSVPSRSVTITAGQLQNGADAVAIYTANAVDFPNDTAVTTSNLVDAVVYDTNDSDDAGLLVLTPGQAQINESENGNASSESIARKPDGGTPLDTSTYVAGPPTPNASNGVAVEAITLSLDSATILESDFGFILATVSRVGSTGNLDINISVNDTSEASLFGTGGMVAISDGFTSATFIVLPVDDTYPDGTQMVTLSATPVGGLEVTEDFDVTDDPGDTYSLVINEINSVPNEDLNGDLAVDNDDQFIEILNISGATVDLTGFTLEDTVSAPSTVHVFRDGTLLENNCAVLVFNGGVGAGATAAFGTAEVQLASGTNGLELTGSGDTMRLINGSLEEVYAVTVPDLTGSPEQGSYVLSTDGSPASGYAQHTLVNMFAQSSPGQTSGEANYCTIATSVIVDVLESSVVEGAGDDAVTVRVSIPSSLGSDLDVFAYSDDTSEISVPFGDPVAEGVISMGDTFVDITMFVEDDIIVDGTQVVTLVGGASGYLNGTDTVDVTDDGDLPPFTDLVINEVDATGSVEFIELFNKTGTERSLEGLVLVLFNGSDDASYSAVNLTGVIPAGGFFLIGDEITGATIDTPASIQNGADAVALFVGSTADFPNDTPVTDIGGAITNTLIDAVVYGTGDLDNTVLLNNLTPGQPQVDESANGSDTTESIARIPDGGAAFASSLYVTQTPTSGATNVLSMGGDIIATEISKSGMSATIEFTSSGNVDVYKTTDLQDFTSLGSPYATNQVSPYTDVSATEAAAYYILVPTGDPAP